MRFIIPIAIIVLSIPMVYGDDAPEVELWIPQHMIAGNTYHGAIILPEATAEGTVVFLSTKDSLIAQVPDSIPILPHQNHGIFEITPHVRGHTHVFAVANGNLYGATSQVFSQKSEPAKLGIVIPAGKTKADTMLAYVTLQDENGFPVAAGADIPVHLAASESISTPSQIMIRNGTTHTMFKMGVGGTGHITATSSTLEPYRTDIEKVQDTFDVRIAVAPKIAMEDSYAFYYVWLEKDGRPLKLPYVIDTYAYTNNADIGRFGPSSTVQSEQDVLHLVDGMGRGIIYTGDRGSVTVTASIADIGSAQDILFVGSARLDSADMDDSASLNGQDFPDANNPESNPNMILSWIYPSVTDRQAWGVVATYNVNKTQSLIQGMEESGQITSTISSDAVIHPARIDGTVHVSSGDGLEHNGAYVLEERILKTNSMEFEIIGASHGHYDIDVSGSGLEPASTHVDIVPQYTQELALHMVAIPALPNTPQDVAMVSILDKTGAMIDPTMLKDADIRISADSASVDSVIRPISGSAIISTSLSGSDTLSAVMDGAYSAEIKIAPARVASSLELLVPPRVHVGEPFPFAVHYTDPHGIPLQKAVKWNAFSPLEISMSEDMMILENPGESHVSVMSDVGAAEYGIVSFENVMEVSFDLPRSIYRVGETIMLEILNSVAAEYALVTQYPFEKIPPDKFAVMLAEKSESAQITVTASRDGYRNVSISETIRVDEIFSLDVSTTGSGDRLSVPFDVIIGNATATARSPYYAELEPDNISIILPDKVTIQDRGYSLDSAHVNGESMDGGRIDTYLTHDIAVTADYRQEILVDVVDGEGSGVYGRGELVTVYAPDRERLSFLIRDTFDHWIGMDDKSARASFVADSDITVMAVYREDYTYLMVLVLMPLLAASMFAISKRTAGLRWAMQDMLERAAAVAGRKKSKKKPETGST